MKNLCILVTVLSLWSRACRVLALYWEANTFPHQAVDNPRRGGSPVCRAPGGHSQATLSGTPPSDMDISGNLESYQHQYYVTAEQAPS